jgi:hypothetical protein
MTHKRKRSKAKVFHQEYKPTKAKVVPVPTPVHHITVPPTHKVIITPLEVAKIVGPTYRASFQWWSTANGEYVRTYSGWCLSEKTAKDEMKQLAIDKGWTNSWWRRLVSPQERKPEDYQLETSTGERKELHEP